jgi:hypothetical protein
MVRFEEWADALVMECMGTGRDEEGLADCYPEETCVDIFWCKKGVVEERYAHIQQSGIFVLVEDFLRSGGVMVSLVGDTASDLSWLSALVLR